MIVLHTTSARSAFTLVEMTIVLALVAITTALVIPMAQDDDELRTKAAAMLIFSDLEMAQVLTVSFPGDPVVFRFDTANLTYWLATASDPDTPINREDNGEPYLVTLGIGRARAAAGAVWTLSDVPNETITFASHGGLADITQNPTVTLACADHWIVLNIAPTTGAITQSNGVITKP